MSNVHGFFRDLAFPLPSPIFRFVAMFMNAFRPQKPAIGAVIGLHVHAPSSARHGSESIAKTCQGGLRVVNRLQLLQTMDLPIQPFQSGMLVRMSADEYGVANCMIRSPGEHSVPALKDTERHQQGENFL